MSSSAAPTTPGNPSTARVVALVSAAHFFSHFYMLLLAPLFPLMREDFGVSYTELGLAITAFSVTTGLTQAPMGFLVDRFGARGLLIAGLLLQSTAIVLIGVFHSYTMLLALMVLSGVANAVYHPADYAILNARVPAERIGRAFSVHTFSGFLGNAVAAPMVAALALIFGWDVALILCGAGGGLVAIVLALNMGALRNPEPATATAAAPAASTDGGIRLLLSVPLLLAVLFFVGLSVFGYGINTFAISALELLHPGNLAQATVVVSAFLFTSPAGVLAGGWVADRISNHDRFVAGCLATVAVCMLVVASVSLPLTVLAFVFAIAGFAHGCVAPSRDMLVRSLTPPGQSGKVFGFVSTGYNIGGIVSPLLFGMILDAGEPNAVFLTVSAVAAATILTVTLTGNSSRRRRALSTG